MNIKENVFDLTNEQIEASKMMYNGKVIKCLVTPYHSFSQLEKEFNEKVKYSKYIYLHPEREMPQNMLSSLVSIIVSSSANEDIVIVTTNQNIITDMIGDCVRVLTEDGEIVYTGTKTFMANIHTIRYELFENENHRKSKLNDSVSTNKINDLIKKIRNSKSVSKSEHNLIISEIDMIGEPIIRNKLKSMASDLTII